MPVEVISLLSSPERSKSQSNADAKVLDNGKRGVPARKLDYDVFDLSDDVAPASMDMLEPSLSISHQPARPKNSSCGKMGVDNDMLFLSDDFDTMGDLEGHTGNAHKGRAAKRIRLSPITGNASWATERPLNKSISTATHINRPAVVQPSGFRRWNSALEPIDFTSSPDIGTHFERHGKTLDNDPFASSSPRDKGSRVNKEQTTSGNGILEDFDPFASSVAKAKPRSPKPVSTWDPISSSAPERSDRVRSPSTRVFSRSRSDVIELLDSDSDPTPSDDELPELGNIDLSKLVSTKLAAKYAVAPPTKPKASSKPAVKKKSTAEQTQDKKERIAAKEAEKELKKKEKEQAKEQRALEKEKAAALAEVNKIRTNKNISTPEMIVDLPSTLNPTIKFQAETLLKDLTVQHNVWDSPVPDVIKWRRKVSSKYNSDLGHWEPIPMRIQNEKHAMVLLPAADFVDLALGAEGADLDAHVSSMQRHFGGHTLIYLIEGLTSWLRKNRNLRNKQFTSAVRDLATTDTTTAAAAPSSTAQQPPSRRRKKDAPPKQPIDEDTIEDALLALQVAHGALIHHTAAPVETAQWIAIFTQHISTIPYRRQKEAANAAAAFCMEAGQVRTGEDARETYVRMLQEIARVTAPIAYGIAAEFETVAGLVAGLEEGGMLRLEGCRKSANKDGAFSERAVGQAVSRRVYKVFTGRDENSTEI